MFELNQVNCNASPTNLDLSFTKDIWHLTNDPRAFYPICPLSLCEVGVMLIGVGFKWSAHELFTSIPSHITISYVSTGVPRHLFARSAPLNCLCVPYVFNSLYFVNSHWCKVNLRLRFSFHENSYESKGLLNGSPKQWLKRRARHNSIVTILYKLVTKAPSCKSEQWIKITTK